MTEKLIFDTNKVTIVTQLLIPIVGKSVHQEEIKYENLPPGIILKINSIHPNLNETGNLTSLVFEVESIQLLSPEAKAQNETAPSRIEIKLTPASIDYWLIPLRKDIRKYFPAYKEDFKVETDSGNVTCWVSGASTKTLPGDLDAGHNILKNLGPWFKAHDFKAGDKVYIEIIEIGKKYRLLDK